MQRKLADRWVSDGLLERGGALREFSFGSQPFYCLASGPGHQLTSLEHAPASVGGLAPVPFAGFKLNFAFEVFYSGVWTAPATIDNGFGNGTIQFASDFTAGFYWNNVDPKLNVNTGTTLAQSASTTITSAMLSSSDVESGAGAITYKVNGLTHNGTLKKNGTGMAVNDTFTQQDIANGIISYTNNGACDTNDDFQFGVTDADGGIAHDGAFTSFSFRFTIALPNNPPTANGASICQVFTA